MWCTLYTRLLCLVPDFKKTSKACKNNFNNLYAKYKIARVGNDLSESNQVTSLYYDEFNQWYHDSIVVVKRASAFATTTKSASISELEGDDSLVGSTVVLISKGAAPRKTKFHD